MSPNSSYKNTTVLKNEMNDDDLLKIFKEVNVDLGDLNPEVIRGWFDTDCTKTKTLLDWLCYSLSKDNYVSLNEIDEYEALDVKLQGDKFEREVAKFESELPGLFDYDSNLVDIEIKEAEIDLLRQQQQHLNQELALNQNLCLNLNEELSKVTNEKHKSKLNAEFAQDSCENLVELLEEKYKLLHEQVSTYAGYLYNCEFGNSNLFITNYDTSELENSFANINRLLNIGFERSILKLERNTGDFENSLNQIKRRIINSKKSLIIEAKEVASLKSILKYLDICDTSENFSSGLEMNLQTKLEEEKVLLRLLDEFSTRFAENYVNKPRIPHAELQLKKYESKYLTLNTIYDTLKKVCANYFVLNLLHSLEDQDIKSSENLFQKTVDYISIDIQDCKIRSEGMNSVMQNYEQYSNSSIETKFSLIQDFGKILNCSEKANICDIIRCFNSLKTDILLLEKRIFISDIGNYMKNSEIHKFENNLGILKKFLTSIYSNEVMVIPQELQIIFKKLDATTDSQNIALKSIVQVSTETNRKLSHEWFRLRRQLWMEFICNPSKLLAILHKIEEETKKH